MSQTPRRETARRFQMNCKVVHMCGFIAEGRPLQKVEGDFQTHINSFHQMYKDTYIVARELFCPCGTLIKEMGPPSCAVALVPSAGSSTAVDDTEGGIYEGLHIPHASVGEATAILRLNRVDTMDMPVRTCRRCHNKGRRYENDDQTVPNTQAR